MKQLHKENTGTVWTISGLFLSGLVGAGFATGREIFIYFGGFGVKGVLGLVSACILLFWAAVRILVIVTGRKMTHVGELPGFVAGRKMALFFTGTIILFSFCGYITMVAGFRDVMAQLVPDVVQHYPGMFSFCTCGIITAFSLFMFYSGFGTFASLCRILTPLLIGCITVTAVVAAFLTEPQSAPLQGQEISVAAVILCTLLYTGYNLLFLVAVLGRAGTLCATRKVICRGSLLGTGLFLIGGIGIFAALMGMGELAQKAMPLQAVMKTLGTVPGIVFSFILGLTMLLCAASVLGATVEAAEGKRFTGAVLALMAIPLSYAGFDVILSVIYPVFGLVGIFLFAVLAQTRGKNV